MAEREGGRISVSHGANLNRRHLRRRRRWTRVFEEQLKIKKKRDRCESDEMRSMQVEAASLRLEEAMEEDGVSW